MRPLELIDACRSSHDRLLQTVATFNDDDVRAPSHLPQWSRAHVITHVARNADSFTWLCAGAIAGESRHQYPTTGMREADIETGSKLPSFELLADLERSCRALDTSFDTLDDGLWDFEVSVRTGRRPLTEIVFSRLREVEVHHVDLAAAYTSSDWPEIYVEGEMNRLLPGLASRADHAAIVQWLIGRGGAPDLGPW